MKLQKLFHLPPQAKVMLTLKVENKSSKNEKHTFCSAEIPTFMLYYSLTILFYSYARTPTSHLSHWSHTWNLSETCRKSQTKVEVNKIQTPLDNGVIKASEMDRAAQASDESESKVNKTPLFSVCPFLKHESSSVSSVVLGIRTTMEINWTHCLLMVTPWWWLWLAHSESNFMACCYTCLVFGEKYIYRADYL